MRHGRPSTRAGLRPALAAVTVLLLAGCNSSSPGGASSTGAGAVTSVAGSATSDGGSGWIRDSITDLDEFAPDASADYFFNLYDTSGGARTLIDGAVPRARYWSFTLYPGKVHLYDRQIAPSGGRFRLTVAARCAGVSGACLASAGNQVGIVVMRIYVPVDYSTSGTGGVPLPTISYRDPDGSEAPPADAPGAAQILAELASYRSRHGGLARALTRTYPLTAPVPAAVNPAPAESRGGQGQFANPDNSYVKIPYTMTRGDLVVSAQAPTFQVDSFPSVNDLDRPASQDPQSRYWSLCTDLVGDYTSACLRDEQVDLQSATDRFVVVIAPACPVPGFANCLAAGPEPLQRALLYRVLLPSSNFAPLAFTGPWALTAQYVARRRG